MSDKVEWIGSTFPIETEVKPRPRVEMTSTDYNKSLLEIDSDKVDNLELLYSTILVRCFQKRDYHSESGLITPNIKLELSESGERLLPRLAGKTFINRGVIVKIGDSCSEEFKKKVKVGSVVELKVTTDLGATPISFGPDASAVEVISNYFILPESSVRAVLNNYDQF